MKHQASKLYESNHIYTKKYEKIYEFVLNEWIKKEAKNVIVAVHDVPNSI